MIYILVLIGFLLIFISLKLDKKPPIEKEFDKLLQNNINSKDIETLVISLKDFSDRIDNIETSLILIQDEIDLLKNTSPIIEEDTFDLTNKENYYEEEIITPIPIDPVKNEVQNINETIYRLYDEGTPVEDISSITKIGKGEILLRLGLRKERK